MKNILTILISSVVFLQCSPKIGFSDYEGGTKYGLHGKLQAKENQGQELANILLEAAALMQSAEGCALYVVSVDQNDPDAVWVTEIWDSKKDHDNSLSIPGVRELIGKAIPLLEGSPQQGQTLEILGGLGLK